MPDDAAEFTITINGEPSRVAPGTGLAAALINAGVWTIRASTTGEPRSAVCGMGACHECRAEVDGVPGVRACMVVCRPGMNVRTSDA
ncbi:MAG: (2Fe-2S)-binding protein [Phycisphaeraceae bacterium]|nr:MAG: (2Fe-2S)-binding protein [Phycisphaeraceae bacterium]